MRTTDEVRKGLLQVCEQFQETGALPLSPRLVAEVLKDFEELLARLAEHEKREQGEK